MLVLVSNHEDLTTDWLVLELERRNEPFVRLCTEDYPTKMGIAWTLDDATLLVGMDSLPAAKISAVWWRRPVAPVIPADERGGEAIWAVEEARAAWQGYWESVVDAHWVNVPAANARAEQKPVQLREAQRLHLRVPPTLVTNDLVAARAFADAHGTVVCKALSSGLVPQPDGGERVLYTQLLNVEKLARVDDLGPEPYLFQAFVEKTADVRVTVIGEHVFACRINSQSEPDAVVDWRRGRIEDMQHEPIELDEDTTRRLQELTAGFGLRFAAIDLAVNSDGRFVFFELNPNGQWAWIEQLTGQPLRAALADELLQQQ